MTDYYKVTIANLTKKQADIIFDGIKRNGKILVSTSFQEHGEE